MRYTDGLSDLLRKGESVSIKEVYKTVEHESETLIIEKKSKFYSHVKPVDNEEAAVAYLDEMRSKYSDATHNVYAYVIDENNIFRYSDDGEPSGTAGMPVLDVIRKSGLVDVAVIITRYFGGTLLGTGGLVHAYSSSAKKGLLESGIIIKTMCDIISVKVDYDLVGKLQYKLAEGGYKTEDTIYENNVTFLVCSPKDKTEQLMKELINATSGRAVMSIVDNKYVNSRDESFY